MERARVPDRKRRQRFRRLELARLNHILIPATKDDRDRAMWRAGWLGKVFSILFGSYVALTEEGRFLAVAWLIVGALGLEVRVTQVYLVWCGITGLLAGSIVLRRFFRAKLGIRTEAPERVAIGETIGISILIENQGPRDALAIRVQGPLLPWDGRWIGAPPMVRRVRPGQEVRALATATFSARGVHHLDPFHVGALVPLGIVVGPGTLSKGTRFVVVPPIAPVTRVSLASSARYQQGGVALASQIGESRELVGLRPYRPGDRVRELSARGWARAGIPLVREYQEEYFTRVGVVLDTDVSAADPETLEAAISLAAGIVAHFTRGEALIDLLVVGDELHRMTLGRSLGFLEQALDLLAAVEPSPAFDAGRLARLLAPHLTRLSAVVVVALAEDDPRRAFVDRVRAAGTGCRAIVVGGGGRTFTSVPVSRIDAKEPLFL